MSCVVAQVDLFDQQTQNRSFGLEIGFVDFRSDVLGEFLEIGEHFAVFLSGPLADRLGVTKYLHPLPKDVNGEQTAGGRIRVAKLRGIASYGLIMRAIDNPEWEVGTDVAGFYGVSKWEPPPENADGKAEREDAAFHRYTNIENFRNFPNLFVPGEEVIFTEKIHGMNSRVGLIQMAEGPTWMAGSHGVRRRELDRQGRRSKFWEVLTDNIKALLEHLAEGTKNVVMFGEIYGSGVHDMTYSMTNGLRTWRAFDITVNGNYLDFDTKAESCAKLRPSRWCRYSIEAPSAHRLVET